MGQKINKKLNLHLLKLGRDARGESASTHTFRAIQELFRKMFKQIQTAKQRYACVVNQICVKETQKMQMFDFDLFN